MFFHKSVSNPHQPLHCHCWQESSSWSPPRCQELPAAQHPTAQQCVPQHTVWSLTKVSNSEEGRLLNGLKSFFLQKHSTVSVSSRFFVYVALNVKINGSNLKVERAPFWERWPPEKYHWVARCEAGIIDLHPQKEHHQSHESSSKNREPFM